MNSSLPTAILASLGLAGLAAAQGTVIVNSDITMSTTWTSNNIYDLQTQIYVRPGATLTIQAGTVIASTTNIGGSLAVAKGAQIFVQGTEKNPVIFTSTADRATWTGGDPKTGMWRAAATEWGNLTVMGDAYISENATMGNTPVPAATNVATMEALSGPFALYGGGDDNDDSGTISYVSLRYGGKVTGANVELNGLSLGGIGRDTDIHHVEIMNNVDDGIEVWGGTLNLKYLSIWNIGDDSLDVDQGWRGKAQFGLIVQGYSLANQNQGSGLGDNAIETDGAEDSDWQPVTTSTIYNFTVIGQPYVAADARGTADHATAWRDNCRMQYRNCVFMDCGEEVVKFDNVDGDGANGYGHNGTLTWAATWTTPYTSFSTVNAPGNPAAFYTAQSSGNLAEIKDSVFYNNVHPRAYTEATARGVFAGANNNVQEPANSPIVSLVRDPMVVVGGSTLLAFRPVKTLDPRPANDALTSVGFAPNDGFFAQAKYRGAFAPGANWLSSWTASTAFGFTPKDAWCDVGVSTGGTNGYPVLSGSGPLTSGSQATLSLSNALPNSVAALAIGTTRFDFPVLGVILVPLPALSVTLPTNGSGANALSFTWPLGTPAGLCFYFQQVVLDPAGPQGASASNALLGTSF